MLRGVFIGVIALVAWLLVPTAALAATKTWTGTNSGNWNDASNWTGGVPGTGDDLVFPSGAGNVASGNNDLAAGISFQSITFNGDGYVIGGNSLAITTAVVSNVASG